MVRPASEKGLRPTSHWGFLESRTFNLAYWRGETELAEHTVILNPPICVPPGVGSNSYAPAYEALVTTPDVKFEFAGFRGYSYELWWSINEGPATHIDVAGPTPAIENSLLPRASPTGGWRGGTSNATTARLGAHREGRPRTTLTSTPEEARGGAP